MSRRASRAHRPHRAARRSRDPRRSSRKRLRFEPASAFQIWYFAGSEWMALSLRFCRGWIPRLAIVQQLLREVAQTLVQPRLLEVDEVVVDVDAARGVDQVLELVREDAGRERVDEPERARVAIHLPGGIGDEHVEHLPFVARGARDVAGRARLHEDVARVEEPADEVRRVGRRQLVHLLGEEDRDLAIPVDVRWARRSSPRRAGRRECRNDPRSARSPGWRTHSPG